jgi:transcriptional regulator with XRE-family HTH domain
LFHHDNALLYVYSLNSIMNDKSLFNQQVGDKLRRLRKAKNKSQASVAADFSFGQDVVSEIERGVKTISAFELAAFSAYYEKPITYFFMNSTLPSKNS